MITSSLSKLLSSKFSTLLSGGHLVILHARKLKYTNKTNLLEEEDKELSFEGNELKLNISHFEIVALKLRF